MASRGCLDFFRVRWSDSFIEYPSLADEEERRAHAAALLQARVRLFLEQLREADAVVAIQAACRGQIARRMPLARGVRLFLRERRRALSLERSLGRMP